MAKPIFRSKNATELLRYAEQIFKKMTENADMFVDPVPDLETLESRLSAYRAAFAEASFRDQRAVILKGQEGERLQEIVYRLSHYVDAVAQGDPGIIVAAGYQPSESTGNRIDRTPKAENLRVSHIQVGLGIVRVRVKPWKPARLYRYEYRKKGSEEWTGILHSSSTVELRGLDKLQEYEFRASYIGRDIEPNFSDTITALVV
ncbi:fibronectin type III domain-containing protein [Sphingobacterium sp. DN00404]|uniref:Fibronectin type III domain-containing protein n=1 Tax=Sphingobacterium micropteri TaxID=2763501 RepID=A0ABR7YPG3_9SPHI|nr:fibronectin type III domain-containing protein [Sphingobacterium micropteri]MBD1433220.1 fibronectin type III domain-containing protein [Sphingobacterium micropteri]